MNDRELVRALKALADANRFRMVQEVAAAGELSCGELAERFDLAQPTVSHHLKILVDAGILLSRTEAKHHFISVNRALVNRVVGLLPDRLGDANLVRTRR
jgi:ArsR family transcriptional regulator